MMGRAGMVVADPFAGASEDQEPKQAQPSANETERWVRNDHPRPAVSRR
jgi:hypothetical protein